MITRKEFFEKKIEDCQCAVWWNEVILKIQEESGVETDATKSAIEKDTKTIGILQNEIKNS